MLRGTIDDKFQVYVTIGLADAELLERDKRIYGVIRKPPSVIKAEAAAPPQPEKKPEKKTRRKNSISYLPQCGPGEVPFRLELWDSFRFSGNPERIDCADIKSYELRIARLHLTELYDGQRLKRSYPHIPAPFTLVDVFMEKTAREPAQSPSSPTQSL